MVKDRQNEERQRKLEELKSQAIAAQKYREQKEDERKRRMDDLRHKELDRKQQVESSVILMNFAILMLLSFRLMKEKKRLWTRRENDVNTFFVKTR